MTLGEIIQKARVRKSLSQRGLGKLLGVSGPAVYAWEKDKAAPDAEKLLKLVSILELQYDLFPNPQPNKPLNITVPIELFSALIDISDKIKKVNQ